MTPKGELSKIINHRKEGIVLIKNNIFSMGAADRVTQVFSLHGNIDQNGVEIQKDRLQAGDLTQQSTAVATQ